MNLPLLSLLLSLSSALAVWPNPKEFTSGNTYVRLASDLNVSANFPDRKLVPQDLLDAIARTQTYVQNKNLQIQRLTPDRGASSAEKITSAPALNELSLILAPGNEAQNISYEAIQPLGQKSEAYELTIPGDGSKAVLMANSTLGLFRGLTTFEQLLYHWNGTTYVHQAPIHIKDSPAYPYRGLMLDTARHYFPVKDIKRTLDAMSWAKINHFHWHVVDSQSFPLKINGFETLANKGAYSPEEVYAQDDITEIINYANARGIDVMVEINIPGHTAAIGASRPGDVACYRASPSNQFAVESPAGQLRIASPGTINFVISLLTAATKIFPSKLFSTGGDEINSHCYDTDSETQQALKNQSISFDTALDLFTSASHKTLEQQQKAVVVWQESALVHNIPSLSKRAKNTIVLVKGSQNDVTSVVQKGYRLIHAAADYFYLDCGAGDWTGSQDKSWCDPFKTWKKAYSFDPAAGLDANQVANFVLGGQQLLWTEQTDPSNLDSIAWPRAAVSAEVFWSGSSKTNATDALRRLHDLRYRFVQRNVSAIALQPHWCALHSEDLEASGCSPS